MGEVYDDEERERAFKRERDAMEAWKTGPVGEPVYDDAQAAWAEWMSKRYIKHEELPHARIAFLAGWRACQERADKNGSQRDRRY